MKVAICDDDQTVRDNYRNFIQLLAKKSKTNIQVFEYETGEQLLFAYEDMTEPLDVIILDILMPKINGIETGQQLRMSGFKGAIIFLTCSDGFMLQAFDIGAYNYVLKQDDGQEDLERFEQVFTKAIKQMKLLKGKYILLNGITSHCNISLDSISYFESQKHVITVHYGEDKTFEFISTLEKTESSLVRYGFFRIQRSYLVNVSAVERYTSKTVILRDGTELPIGRQRYRELDKMMNDNATVNFEDDEADTLGA